MSREAVSLVDLIRTSSIESVFHTRYERRGMRIDGAEYDRIPIRTRRSRRQTRCTVEELTFTLVGSEATLNA